MKKFFSLIALVGVFAACQKEDLKTAFSVSDAVATITASAVCIDGNDINDVEYTFSEGTSSGNVCTITGNPSIDKVVKVKATWKGYDGFKSFSDEKEVVVRVLANGKGAYKVSFILGEFTSPEGYVYQHEDKEIGEMSSEAFSLVNSHLSGHTAKVDGYDVYVNQNPSEFILRGTVDYKAISGDKPVKVEYFVEASKIPAQYASMLNQLAIGTYEEVDDQLDITVSAFAQYYVLQVVNKAPRCLSVWRTDANGLKEDVAKITYDNYSSTISYVEQACEGHEAHYVEGHGHDCSGHDGHGHGHGHGGSNAGGGIIYGD